MPLLRAFWDAALDVDPERAGAIDDGRRVGYGHDGDLAELWEAHGLVDVTAGELWVKASYASFADLFEPFTAGTGHSGACYAALDRAEQRRLRDQARGGSATPRHRSRSAHGLGGHEAASPGAEQRPRRVRPGPESADAGTKRPTLAA